MERRVTRIGRHLHVRLHGGSRLIMIVETMQSLTNRRPQRRRKCGKGGDGGGNVVAFRLTYEYIVCWS
jgi:hypothetical protein